MLIKYKMNHKMVKSQLNWIQVHKLAEAKYREWKEQESKEMMEKVRQQHHFESTWRTGLATTWHCYL